MEARYKFDEGSEGGGVVTSITVDEDEVDSLLLELGNLGVSYTKKRNKTPALGQLFRLLETLETDFRNDGDKEDDLNEEDDWNDKDDDADEDNYCSKCGKEIED